MDNDNIYPNSTEFFFGNEPVAQKEARSQSVEDTLAQLPLLKEVLDHIDGRIEATDSVKQAMMLAKQYSITKEEALIVFDVVRQQLETEKSFIGGRIERVKSR